jgi:predicted nucleic acid-binding protein
MALQLLIRFQQYLTRGKQVHDANIVATMLAHEIDTLLTLNVDDMKRFADKIRIVSLEGRNP